MMTLDDGPMEKMSDDEPLEHSVLDAAVTCRRVAGHQFGLRHSV